MYELFGNAAHADWRIHDVYWVGACIFIAHFIWLSPAFLRRKKVIFSLIVMTAFWPLTYSFSIFQVVRMRRLKS
jgi:hypothetical protein